MTSIPPSPEHEIGALHLLTTQLTDQLLLGHKSSVLAHSTISTRLDDEQLTKLAKARCELKLSDNHATTKSQSEHYGAALLPVLNDTGDLILPFQSSSEPGEPTSTYIAMSGYILGTAELTRDRIHAIGVQYNGWLESTLGISIPNPEFAGFWRKPV